MLAINVYPETVYEEVVKKGKEKEIADAFRVETCVKEGVFSIEEAASNDFFTTLLQNNQLSQADVAVLSLAKKTGGTAIIDEEYARNIAEIEGIGNRGTVFLIFRLLKQQVMASEEGRAMVDEMIDEGWYCSLDLYKEIMNGIRHLEDERD